MTKLLLSLTIAKVPRARRLLKSLTLAANGPTDYEDCFRRLDSENVWNWVRRNCVEEEKEEYKAEADVKGLKGEENWVNPWEPLVCNLGGASVETIEGSEVGKVLSVVRWTICPTCSEGKRWRYYQQGYQSCRRNQCTAVGACRFA